MKKQIILSAIVAFSLLTSLSAQPYVYFTERFGRGPDNLTSPNLSRSDSKVDNILYFFLGNGMPTFSFWPQAGTNSQPDRTNTFVRIASSWQQLGGRQDNFVFFDWFYEANAAPNANIVVGVQARARPSDPWIVVDSIRGNQFPWSSGVTGDMRFAGRIPASLFQGTGSDSVQVAIYFNYGPSTSLNFFFDFSNFSMASYGEVFGAPYAQFSVNTQGIFLTTPSASATVATISFSNESDIALNNVKFAYTRNDGTVQFLDRTIATPLQMFGSTSFNLSAQELGIAQGDNNIKMWVSELNGAAVNVSSIDTVTFHIANPDPIDAEFPTTYLVEHFTSSTCPPCVGMNTTMNPYYQTQNTAGRLIYIKYPTNFPGTGDPYFRSADILPRMGYYAIDAVPTVFGNATRLNPGNTSTTQAKNNLEAAVNAFVGTKSFYDVQLDSAYISQVGNGPRNLHVSYTITPKITAEVTIQTVVYQEKTFGNVATNGEREFHHTVMKMFPDGNGNVRVLEKGVPYTVTYTHNMSNTFIEGIDNLHLVVFIQNDKTKGILSATQRKINHNPITATPTITTSRVGDSVQVTITPATSGEIIRFTTNNTAPTSTSTPYTGPFWINRTTTIRAIAWSDITATSKEAMQVVTLTVETPVITFEDLGAGCSMVTITSATEGVIIRYTTNGLPPNTTSTIYQGPFVATHLTLSNITVRAMATKTGWTNSPGTRVDNIPACHPDVSNQDLTAQQLLKVFPNPTSDYVNIEYSGNAKLSLFNMNGVLVYEGAMNGYQKLSLEEFPSGIYMLRVVSDEGTATERIIKR